MYRIWAPKARYEKIGEKAGELHQKQTRSQVVRETRGSTPRVPWLRGRLENSNLLLVRIPVEIHLFERGLQAIRMDPARLPQMLGLSDQDIARLRQAEMVCVPTPMPRLKERIDYVALQQTYARMLAERSFSSQAELAIHLGVSRVWVSSVVRGIRRKAD